MGADSDPKTEELAAIIRTIQERVRARHPSGQVSSLGITLPDLMPVVHARDAAEAKVAAIGTVNPRPGGAINSDPVGKIVLKKAVPRRMPETDRRVGAVGKIIARDQVVVRVNQPHSIPHSFRAVLPEHTVLDSFTKDSAPGR